MPQPEQTEVIIGGTYRVIRLIGEGGMGTVYAVEHIILQKQFALKMLSTENFTPVEWQRFRNEAQTLAHLKHNCIVQVTDLGIHQNQSPYYVMELLHGKPLSHKIKSRGKLNLKEALPLFRQVAEALAFVHDHGIIHRDIKPDNIMLEPGPDGEIVKIVDFGIAKLTQKDGMNLTATGEVFGSPLYMSPEQCSGHTVDARSDIYSYACIFYEALTGTAPIMGDNAVMTMMLKQTTTAPSLGERVSLIDFPAELEDLMASMLAKAKEDRPLSLRTVAVKLKSIQKTLEQPDGSGDTTREAYNIGPAYKGRRTSVIETIDSDQEAEELSGDEITASRLKLAGIAAGALLLAGALTLAAVALWPKPPAKKLTATTPGVIASELLPGKIISQSRYDDFEKGRMSRDNAYDQQAVAAIKVLSSTGPRADGMIVKKYFFPEKFSIGNYARWGVRKNNGGLRPGKFPATGYIEAPLGGISMLSPIDDFIANPTNFAKFGDNELTELECPRSRFITTDFFKQIMHIKSLKTIKLNGSSINNDTVKMLDQLPSIDKAEVGSIDITDDVLSKCKFITRMRHLSVNQICPITKTLRAIAACHNGNIKAIGLSDIKFSKEDIDLIARLKTLEHLYINGTNVTDQDLQKLQHLPLVKLEISRCNKLTPDCAETLKKFPNLKIIDATKLNWSKQKSIEFCRALSPRTVDVTNEEILEIIP